jgi:hypothetical protein
MLPSLFSSADHARPWSMTRAAAYGAGIGALAACFKALAPLHQAHAVGAGVLNVVAGALVFALLCAGAAALRNFLARRLIWPDAG